MAALGRMHVAHSLQGLAPCCAADWLRCALPPCLTRLLCAVKAALDCGQDLDALHLRTQLPEGRRLG